MTVIEEMEETKILAEAILVAAEIVLVATMKMIMAALAGVILVVPVHPAAVSQLWTLKKEGKLQEWVDVPHTVETVVAIMAAPAVEIPDALREITRVVQEEATPVVQEAVGIQEDLLPVVTGEGVHRIVRVVLVRQGADLQQCLKKK